VTRDDLAELRDWYGRAVRDLERPADMTERRQGVPGPDRPPRFVLSGDAAGAYLAAPPAQVRDTAGRGIVRDRARALQLVSGGSDLMAKMAADLMPDLRRGRRSLDPAAWIRAIAWYHLVSGGMTQREAARVVILWDDECGAPGADPDAAALLRRRAGWSRLAERQRLRDREAAVVAACRRIVALLQSANKTP